MARKTKGQQTAQAGVTQEVSGGPVRVDAKAVTGGKSQRTSTSLQPTLGKATEHLEQTGFQSGQITSPSGVSVRFSRVKGDEGAAVNTGYSARAQEFGDKNAPPVGRGVSGAAPGEARWAVSRSGGEDTVAKAVNAAKAVAKSPDPITSHPTLSVVRGLAEENNRGSLRNTGRAARRIATQDPTAATALQSAYERQQRITSANARVRSARRRSTGTPSQDLPTSSRNAGQAQNDVRSRAMQGFVHTQQAGADVRHEIRLNQLEHDQLRREAAAHPDPEIAASLRHAAGAATRGIGVIQARNRASMIVNRRQMGEVVGTQPENVRAALPPGTSNRTGRKVKGTEGGTLTPDVYEPGKKARGSKPKAKGA